MNSNPIPGDYWQLAPGVYDFGKVWNGGGWIISKLPGREDVLNHIKNLIKEKGIEEAKEFQQFVVKLSNQKRTERNIF